jgi:hypothetical protein
VISRPERHIRESFEEQYYSVLHLHDIEHHIVHADFSLYLKDRRSTELETTTLYKSSWPPPQIGIIAQHAGNLFVYGSTIYKYIAYRGDPVERLLLFSTPQGLESFGEVAVQKEAIHVYTRGGF